MKSSYLFHKKIFLCIERQPEFTFCVYSISVYGKQMLIPENMVGHLTRKPGVLGSIPGLATYFRFSFRFFKKGSCQLLAKVCTRSTG